MKFATIEQPGTVRIGDMSSRQPDRGEVLIRVMASGICGTDIHIFRGEYIGSYPVIPGHEFAGEVVEIGGGGDPL